MVWTLVMEPHLGESEENEGTLNSWGQHLCMFVLEEMQDYKHIYIS